MIPLIPLSPETVVGRVQHLVLGDVEVCVQRGTAKVSLAQFVVGFRLGWTCVGLDLPALVRAGQGVL